MKKRLYELSREFKVDHKEVIKFLNENGFTEIKSHMKELNEEQVNAVSSHFKKMEPKDLVNFYGIIKDTDGLFKAVRIKRSLKEIRDDLEIISDNPKKYKSAAIIDFEKVANLEIYRDED